MDLVKVLFYYNGSTNEKVALNVPEDPDQDVVYGYECYILYASKTSVLNDERYFIELTSSSGEPKTFSTAILQFSSTFFFNFISTHFKEDAKNSLDITPYNTDIISGIVDFFHGKPFYLTKENVFNYLAYSRLLSFQEALRRTIMFYLSTFWIEVTMFNEEFMKLSAETFMIIVNDEFFKIKNREVFVKVLIIFIGTDKVKLHNPHIDHLLNNLNKWLDSKMLCVPH